MPPEMNTGAAKEGLARVPALDLLRLIAVLAVLLSHYGFSVLIAPGVGDVVFPGIEAVAKYGYLGVKAFFIISGFVIAYSAEGRTSTEFAIARVARIYPGFLCCMTLTFLATLAFGAPYFEATATQWAANLFIAASLLKQQYMDSAYWSLVSEVVFYGWVYLMMVAGIVRRRIGMIVLIWLSFSVINETMIKSILIQKIFLTDSSGFFATGLLLYEFYVGRRNVALQCLLAYAASCAVFQAVDNLHWWREHFVVVPDEWVVAAICLAAIVTVMQATRIRRLPLPSGVIIAIGGATYPLYLLHQNIGYMAFKQIGPVAHPVVVITVVVLALMTASWAIWRYVERPGQRLLKLALNKMVSLVGRASMYRQLDPASLHSPRNQRVL